MCGYFINVGIVAVVLEKIVLVTLNNYHHPAHVLWDQPEYRPKIAAKLTSMVSRYEKIKH